MVEIKDMEMPSCCAYCYCCVEDKYADKTCVLLGSEWEESDYNKNHRDEKCPLEEKVGKWIPIWDSEAHLAILAYQCSKCGIFTNTQSNYCADCGSKNERYEE